MHFPIATFGMYEQSTRPKLSKRLSHMNCTPFKLACTLKDNSITFQPCTLMLRYQKQATLLPLINTWSIQIFQTDTVKIIKLTIRPIGCHRPRSITIIHNLLVGQNQLDDLNLAPCQHLCRLRSETHIAG
jgi:hypothetical protein